MIAKEVSSVNRKWRNSCETLDKLQNVKTCEMEGKDERSKKSKIMERLWKWKITAMLQETQVITLWKMGVGNDAKMNRIILLIIQKAYNMMVTETIR